MDEYEGVKRSPKSWAEVELPGLAERYRVAQAEITRLRTENTQLVGYARIGYKLCAKDAAELCGCGASDCDDCGLYSLQNRPAWVD